MLRCMFAVALCLLLLGGSARAAAPLREVPLDPQVGDYEIGDYRYVLSEAIGNDGRTIRTGALLRYELPIAGDDFFRLELPIGSFIWHPSHGGDGKQGWQRIDSGKKHPEWYMAVIEPPAKDARYLRTRRRDPIAAPPAAIRREDFARPTHQ